MHSPNQLAESLRHMLPNKPLILFDGVCNLCLGSVQFIINHDAESQLMLASLQSDAGEKIRHLVTGEDTEMKSIIFIDKGNIYTHSTAALNIAAYLDGNWKYMRYFKILPLFLRDGIYKFIARNRYAWFGKQNTCWLPTPELQKRFWK